MSTNSDHSNEGVRPTGCHPTHRTYVSDSSMCDEKCALCGAADVTNGGWGRLPYPCPASDERRREYDERIKKLRQVST